MNSPKKAQVQSKQQIIGNQQTKWISLFKITYKDEFDIQREWL